MKIPETPKTIYSVNEGNYTTWDENMQKAVDGFKFSSPAYTARYVGSMVADVHRTIMYGGVYLYPADAKKVWKRIHSMKLLALPCPALTKQDLFCLFRCIS